MTFILFLLTTTVSTGYQVSSFRKRRKAVIYFGICCLNNQKQVTSLFHTSFIVGLMSNVLYFCDVMN